jgi:hypothetical protein
MRPGKGTVLQSGDSIYLTGSGALPAARLPEGAARADALWAYPREFVDADAASQVTGSPNRFTTSAARRTCSCSRRATRSSTARRCRSSARARRANDTYVEQLVASAQAAIDKVVEMGVADRDRIGVGGHSYGAFMTANLLAHSDIFRPASRAAARTTAR